MGVWAGGGRFKVVLGLHNNVLEVWDIPPALLVGKTSGGASKKERDSSTIIRSQNAPPNEKAALLKVEKDAISGSYRRVSSIELPGHRSDIRSVCFSSDDSLLMSTSNGSFAPSLVPAEGWIIPQDCRPD